MFRCNSNSYINAVNIKFTLGHLNNNTVWNILFVFFCPHHIALTLTPASRDVCESCMKLCITLLTLFLPAGCPMSDWSVWSVCSCVSQRQQRYRVALSPAIRGQQCTPVETQSRACSLSQCAGELKKNAKKKCTVFFAFYIFLLCFFLLTSNMFHIFIVHGGSPFRL